MKDYVIYQAIKRADYGPKTDFAFAYSDYIEFTAESDSAAVKFAEARQRDHDAIYVDIACDDDYQNAPAYVSNLYRVHEDDLVLVEIEDEE